MATPRASAFLSRTMGVIVFNVLLCAGVLKLVTLDEFRSSLDDWKYIPLWARDYIALILPSVECLIGGCGVLGVHRRGCMAVTIFLLSMFLGVSGFHLFQSQPPQCKCFGMLEAYVNQKHSLQVTMWRCGVFLAMGFVSLVLDKMRVDQPLSDEAKIPQDQPVGRMVGGFSLIELLCVIAVIAVLIGIIIPTLRHSKRAGMATATLSHLRTHTTMLSSYAADWKDSVVCWGNPSDAKVRLYMDGQEFAPGGFFTISSFWPAAVASSYYGTKSSDEVFFPKEQSVIKGVGGNPFVMSCSLLADSEFWNMPTRTGISQVRGQKLSSVSFPSSKAAFVSVWSFLKEKVDPEGSQWRMRDPAYESVPEAARPVPIAFVDGSARSYRREDVLMGIGSGEVGSGNALFHGFDVWAGLHTVDGVRGVDVRK